MTENQPEKMPPVPPFVRFVASAVPMVFDDSLSYYEALCALWKYVQGMTDVINNNATLEEEYIEKFIELKSFVDNYFNNLDVQEEINNKLDAMAEDGTLQEIITSYIQANVAWTFDTVADMKLSENLIAGSYAQTLGYHTINDGGGATYYITDSGTADEMDIIAVGDSLYANIVLPNEVTPEMFGAYGDGIHDDTNAWNKAVSVNRDVKAFEKTYLVSTIEITNNINVDCGQASFISSENVCFDIHGKIEQIISNGDYTKNSNSYTITHADYNQYTGMAVLVGDNNFQESRSYYVGGFTCKFKDGKLEGAYPVDVENTQISIITPVTGSLKNVASITHNSYGRTTNSIKLTHALGYKLENIKSKQSSGWSFITIDYCMNCICDNIIVNHSYTSDDNVSYIIEIDDSTFCSVINSTLHNDKWHCITTGGTIMVYHTLVDNCELTSLDVVAYNDHNNARNTIITNSVISNIGVSGMATVDNVNVLPISPSGAQRRCEIVIQPTTAKEDGIYTISNVKFIADNINMNFGGIELGISPQVSGKTFYIDQLNIENVKVLSTDSDFVIFATNPSSYTLTLGTINIEKSNLSVYLNKGWANLGLSTMIMNINNCNDTVHNGSYMFINANSLGFNELNISNSKIARVAGDYNILRLNNVYNAQQPSSTNLRIANEFSGSNISNYQNSVLLTPTVLNISNMKRTDNDILFNLCSITDHKYYQHISGTNFVTVEIA